MEEEEDKMSTLGMWKDRKEEMNKEEILAKVLYGLRYSMPLS